MKQLLSGNEAVARGAYEAGVKVAAAYPGTPSTEILENIVQYKEIYAEWSVNEKIAFEVAYGAAIGGQRALAAMKHVGVNVAADPLMTSVYTGINAGLVLVSADDPAMHSSQNEQDNRYYAKFAQIPMLEPADSQEAKDFVILAFEISEKFDTPVLLRLTTRICHGKSVVEPDERIEKNRLPYKRNAQKYVMIPAYARKRHEILKKRFSALISFVNSCNANRIEIGDLRIGVITSGIGYQYSKEVFPNASFFKLAMTHPLPIKKIKEFAQKVKKLYIIEELEPFMEEQLRAAGIKVTGKDILPHTGEYSPELLRSLLNEKKPKKEETTVPSPLPGRPPVMCAGCPHRAVFHVLKRLKTIVSGDIGCYTLSTLPPLDTMDTCLCMGASIGVAQGLVRVLNDFQKNKVVAVLGDSTFIHAGIPALVNAVYNQSNITIIILDNRITAMTGHQENPGTGKTLQGNTTRQFDFESVARAIGAGYVETIDPINLVETEKVIKHALQFAGPSVVIARRPCVLVEHTRSSAQMQILSEKCTACNNCLFLGCPAISIDEQGRIMIDETACTGCTLCEQVCRFQAIVYRQMVKDQV
jgi:indolepyruvate ferredoxin oxidoreductase alpha subunit